MTIQRYDITESLNRLYRLLRGDAALDDTPGNVTGEIYSKDEALSRIAELLANSLPGETFTIPGTVSISSSSLPTGVVPAEYGGISTVTGTVTMSVSTSYVNITGSWQNEMVSSTNVTPSATGHQITIPTGHIFVQYQVSFSGASGTTFSLIPYLGSTELTDLGSQVFLRNTDDIRSASAVGVVDITSAGNLTLRVKANGASKNFRLLSGQLSVLKVADT